MKNKPKVEERRKKETDSCADIDCPFHGKLRIRGRSFQGTVIKKFPRRITIEFTRMAYIRKYERYAKFRTKIHARVPNCMEEQIHIGDLIQIGECRPLSKIIHFVTVKKIKERDKEK